MTLYSNTSLIFLFTFFSILSTFSQSPTDCVNAVVVCGNSNINLDVNGIGVQEIAGLGCSSQENNSLWLRVRATTDGTIGFNLIPESVSIQEDYDFWVFGPNVTCNNLGLPIRCSTTNPQAAGQGNNHTGMNASSTDTAEGPGAQGNSFVRELDVLQDEVYFIVIDRPVGNSGFNLEWTGTAGLGEQPINEVANTQILDFEGCDNLMPFNDNVIEIDLDAKTPDIIGTQTNISVSYHSNESDAIQNINPLTSPYNNTNPNETIFVRITNDVTDCFDISSFDITVFEAPVANDTTLFQCDEDGINDGLTVFNLELALERLTVLDSDITVELYTSTTDAQNGNNPITDMIFYNLTNPQVLTAKISNTATGCEATAQLTLQANISQIPDHQVPAVCDELDSEDGINTFNLDDIATDMLVGLPMDTSISFYESEEDALFQQNELVSPYSNTTPYSQTLYARANNNSECVGIGEVSLTIHPLPQILGDETAYLCLNLAPQPTTLFGGVVGDLPNNYYYDWSTGETTSFIEVNQTGAYTVTVTNTLGCSKTRTIVVEPSNIATIETIEVNDASSNNVITVLVSGEGSYEFALENANGNVTFPFQESNIFTNVPAGIYTVLITDVKNNCGIVEETVSVIGFPKFLTPNNDGYNDTWNVKGISSVFYPNSVVYIFDRQGKLLTQLDPLSTGWDGTFNGYPLPQDDYWFSVTLQDGREYKDHFTLKR